MNNPVTTKDIDWGEKIFGPDVEPLREVNKEKINFIGQ